MSAANHETPRFHEIAFTAYRTDRFVPYAENVAQQLALRMDARAWEKDGAATHNLEEVQEIINGRSESTAPPGQIDIRRLRIDLPDTMFKGKIIAVLNRRGKDLFYASRGRGVGGDQSDSLSRRAAVEAVTSGLSGEVAKRAEHLSAVCYADHLTYVSKHRLTEGQLSEEDGIQVHVAPGGEEIYWDRHFFGNGSSYGVYDLAGVSTATQTALESAISNFYSTRVNPSRAGLLWTAVTMSKFSGEGKNVGSGANAAHKAPIVDHLVRKKFSLAEEAILEEASSLPWAYPPLIRMRLGSRYPASGLTPQSE